MMIMIMTTGAAVICQRGTASPRYNGLLSMDEYRALIGALANNFDHLPRSE